MAAKKIKSVLQKEKVCYICGTTRNLEGHHVFSGSANRKRSDKRGLVVWLCDVDHRIGKSSVHNNPNGPVDLYLKTTAQRHYEEHIGSREQFRQEFGKSFILEDE